MAETEFSGVWLSSYTFHDVERDKDFKSEHYVRIFQSGDNLVIESLPGKNSAYLILRLHLMGNIATGSWQEETSPEGFFKGSIYNGAIQLIVSDDKKSMKGKWVAFVSSKQVNSNIWELKYLGEQLHEDTPPIQTEKPM